MLSFAAPAAAIALSLLALTPGTQAGNVVVNPNKLPYQTEKGQYGWNNCYGRKDSSSAKCQTLWIGSLTDFCLWAPPETGTIGDAEARVVSYCTKAGHGARLIPKGAIKGAHYIRTPHYIQITGVGDFTGMHIRKGDDGGELDPHGADGNGNPVGGIVIANIDNKKVQIQEWTSFISDNEFCIRACLPGKDAKRWCNHIYDVLGCYWNLPGNYNTGFDSCKANDVSNPMGEYNKNGGTSTFYQGQKPTPPAHAPAKSSQCKKINTIPAAKYPAQKRSEAARSYFDDQE